MAQVQDQKEQVFALAKGRDATQLDLSAAEGYLLSRIDGVTPWRLLREIGGIPANEVDTCLASWLEAGVLEVVSNGSASSETTQNKTKPQKGEKPAADASKSTSADPKSPPMDAASVPNEAPPAIDESALCDSLEISLDVQRRILEFEAGLGQPYHALLGVERGAAPKQVKRAYFKLSKEFHPDRYFRKEIGNYGERLDRIFKKVLEAHEILSDPELCQVENQAPPPPPAAEPETVAKAGPVDAASAPPESESATAKPKAKSKQAAKLERLRQRMPFKINHEAIANRRARADEIFRAAQLSQEAGKTNEAEQSIRIAISFDPGRAEFKEALGALKIQAAGARATKLLATPSDRMSDGEMRETLKLLEDVLPYRPHDPDLNERAAQVCLRLGKHEDALEYVETLLERTPEYAPGYTLLGKIHRGCGAPDKAVEAFEKALKFDEEDVAAQRGLAAVRIGARDAARGGDS